MCSYCLDGIFSVETRIVVSQVHPQMLFFMFVKFIFIKPMKILARAGAKGEPMATPLICL